MRNVKALRGFVVSTALSIIPVKTGIQFMNTLDPRVRGDDNKQGDESARYIPNS